MGSEMCIRDRMKRYLALPVDRIMIAQHEGDSADIEGTRALIRRTREVLASLGH